MSEDSLKQIITHAVVKADFRKLLLSDPVRALAGYKLTDEEKAIFQNLSTEDFETLAGILENRISRALSRKPSPTAWTCGACGG